MIRKKEGITLIALVITIIVLLILAGVTLSLVSGENGILKRATETVEVNEKATAEEEANLVVADIATEYYEEKYVNQKPDLGTIDDFIKEQLRNPQTTEGGYTVEYDTTQEKVIVSKGDRPISFGEIENGRVNWSYDMTEVEKPDPSTPEQIEITNIGNYVDLETDVLDKTIALSDGTTPKTDWRMFYKDENNVYLIMSDYLPYEKNSVLETGLAGKGSSYRYSWISNISREDLAMRLKDTNKWNKLIADDLVSRGASVTGAVELEEWRKAWGQAGGTKIETGIYSPPSGFHVYERDLDNTQTLFFPHSDKVFNCYGYWLCTLSEFEAKSIVRVSSWGYINDDWFDDADSVRPVVCMPASLLKKDESGIWKVAK